MSVLSARIVVSSIWRWKFKVPQMRVNLISANKNELVEYSGMPLRFPGQDGWWCVKAVIRTSTYFAFGFSDPMPPSEPSTEIFSQALRDAYGDALKRKMSRKYESLVKGSL